MSLYSFKGREKCSNCTNCTRCKRTNNEISRHDLSPCAQGEAKIDIWNIWKFFQRACCSHVSWYFLWLKIWVTESTMIQRVAFKTSTCGQKEKTWSITRSKDAQNPVIIIYARSSFSHPDLGYHLGQIENHIGVVWVSLGYHLRVTWVTLGCHN